MRTAFCFGLFSGCLLMLASLWIWLEWCEWARF